MSGDALAAAAEALVGSGYRLHGRDPATGLDCVGVLAVSLAAIGRPVSFPSRYGLRSRATPPFEVWARAGGMIEATTERPGDVLVARPGPCQHHLLISVVGAAFVHAHAGLRRVVRMPAPLCWPIIGRWRLI